MIHSGAIVAAGLSQGFSPTLGIDLGVWLYVQPFLIYIFSFIL